MRMGGRFVRNGQKVKLLPQLQPLLQPQPLPPARRLVSLMPISLILVYFNKDLIAQISNYIYPVSILIISTT